MKLRMMLAAVVGALALTALPAIAPADQPAEPGSQGKAYGVYCKAESREHVKGEKGTAFSRCVTAMAHVANDEDLTPSQACKEMSHEHVKGEKGTAFSRCVTAAAKLRKEQQQQV
jgi:uncharacterized membrane protein